MVDATSAYGIGTTVELDHTAAIERVKATLADEGFGVLCEIDVAATLKKKLGVEFPPYVILGACNPPLAHRALLEEIDIGLLLPCNVIVRSSDEPGTTVIAALDPVVALGLTGRSEMRPLAEEVRARLVRALEAVEHARV